MDYIKELVKIVGKENVITQKIDLICYDRDMSVHEGKGDVLVFVKNKDEVSKILKLANDNKIPVVPRGSGTSVTGAVLPAYGGIVLDLSKMNKIKEINPYDRYVVVEPGVVCEHLNRTLGPKNFFPPDPGSSAVASIGGMVSTNSSGLRAVKYGTTKDYVLGLEVVMANGDIIHTGTKAPKSSAGYDLTRMFVCSEGTLGVITEITLKILPVPEYFSVVLANFKKVEDAGLAISEIMAAGIPLSACEIMDKLSIEVVNKVLNASLPNAECLMLMEVDGPKSAVVDQIKHIVDVCKKFDVVELKSSDDPKERAKMWAGRSGLVSSLSRLKPGYRLIPIVEDFGVPISKMPQVIREVEKIVKENAVVIATFGHVGDGNMHTSFIMDVTNEEEWKKIRKVADLLMNIPLKLNGTLSAEHGVGLAKTPFLVKELGKSLDVMKKIKNSLDPNNILNPGKMGLKDGTDIYDFFAFKDVINKKGILFSDDLDKEILLCVMCGFCRAVCPMFDYSGIESWNARGKMILAFKVLSGKIPPSPELMEQFSHCTTCMNCTASCPSRIRVVEIVEKVREYLVDNNVSLPEHKKIHDNIVKTHNPYGEDQKKRDKLIALSRV